MNKQSVELIKIKLLIKLYQCFNHDKEFDDLKTNVNTRI